MLSPLGRPLQIHALVASDAGIGREATETGSVFGADEGAERTQGPAWPQFCEHMPCLQAEIEALHRDSRRDPDMHPARLDRYLHACGLVNACGRPSSLPPGVQEGGVVISVQCLCGDPDHTLVSVSRPGGSCFPFQISALRRVGGKSVAPRNEPVRAVVPIGAFVMPLGDSIQYSNLPDLGDFLRSLLALCVQPVRPGNDMYRAFGAVRSPRCRQKGAAVCGDASEDPMASLCLSLLRDSIPILKKSKRAVGRNTQLAPSPTQVETTACINVLHGTLLGLYPLGAKRPTFNARVALACRLHGLLTAGPAEQLAFLHGNRNLVRLCFMEYTVNVLSDYMPSERVFLTEDKAAMQQFQTVCPTLCDAFRAEHLGTGAEPWQGLDACALVCIERCLRICKCKIQGGRAHVKGAATPLPLFDAQWSALPCTYGNYDLLRSVCCPDIQDHVVRCASRIQGVVSVHRLPLDILRQQRECVARTHGSCSTRAYAACNIHLCVHCCVKARAFRPELRQCTETGRLCCIHCPENTVVRVSMLGVMLRIAQCSFYMCPFCAEIRAWSGDGQDFLQGAADCALHGAMAARGPNADQERRAARCRKSLTDCRVCGHKSTVSPPLILPNLETRRLEVIGLCKRHAPYKHRICAVWAYKDMQSLVRASAGR